MHTYLHIYMYTYTYVLANEYAYVFILFKQVHFLKGIPKDPFAAAFCRCNVFAFWGFALSLQLFVIKLVDE